MAHDDDGFRSCLLRRLPPSLSLRLAAALLALSCVGEPPRDAPPTFASSRPAVASPSPTASPSPPCPDPCREPPITRGSFPVAAAPEASGLVASGRHDGVLYVLDDGPATTGVLVISAEDAGVVGRVDIEGLNGTDTEALAAGPCGAGGGRCIYVADIGDNLRARDSVSVHRFREPRTVAGAATVAADSISLRYPDGPRDAETLLVDRQGRLGIVTKDADEDGAGAARLYVTSEFHDATLDDRGRVAVPSPLLPFAAAVVGNVVTGGDWAPGKVALRTYDAIFEFRSPSGRGGLLAFPEWPVTEVAVAPEGQGEAIAYGTDHCSLFTLSEGSGTLSAAMCR